MMESDTAGHVPPLPLDALESTRATLAAHAPGGRAVAAWLDPAGQPAGWADARTAAWEALHTGPWRSVRPEWRAAYGGACVLAARSLLVEGGDGGGEPAAASALAALDLADRALMMGGPAFHPAAHALVAAAESRLADETAASLAALPPTWPGPPGPPSPPLPPGSLADGLPGRRVPALTSLPSLAAFAADHLPSPARPDGAPVVLSGLAAGWPALAAWATPAGLVAAVGPHRTVPIELGDHYLAEGWGQQLQRFGRFVSEGMAASGGSGGDKASTRKDPRLPYLAQHDLLAQVPGLRAAVSPSPDYCALPAGGSVGGGGGDEHDDGDDRPPPPPTTNVWLGPAGTVSPPHTDPHANLLVQVVGVKYVRLYHPAAGPAGLEGGGQGGVMANTSRVDLASLTPAPPGAAPPGAPPAASLPFQDTLLHPGDALFIPRGWWHYVQALSPSASVSHWWD